jgi:hypothetical protein
MKIGLLIFSFLCIFCCANAHSDVQKLELDIYYSKMSPFSGTQILVKLGLKNITTDTLYIKKLSLDSILETHSSIFLESEENLNNYPFNSYILFKNIKFNLMGGMLPFYVSKRGKDEYNNKFLSPNRRLAITEHNGVKCYRINPLSALKLNTIFYVERSKIPELNVAQRKALEVYLAVKVNYLSGTSDQWNAEWLVSKNTKSFKNTLVN